MYTFGFDGSHLLNSVAVAEGMPLESPSERTGEASLQRAQRAHGLRNERRQPPRDTAGVLARYVRNAVPMLGAKKRDAPDLTGLS